MYKLKKIGKLFTSKFVGTGPSSYEKRIYQVAVSQRLRNTDLEDFSPQQYRCDTSMSDWKNNLQTNNVINSMVQGVLGNENVYSCSVLKFPAWIKLVIFHFLTPEIRFYLKQFKSRQKLYITIL
jgi:hypothetical protein